MAIRPNPYKKEAIQNSLIVIKQEPLIEPDLTTEFEQIPFTIQFNVLEPKFESLNIAGLKLLEIWSPEARSVNKKIEKINANRPIFKQINVKIDSISPPTGFRMIKAGYVRKEQHTSWNNSTRTYYAIKFCYIPTPWWFSSKNVNSLEVENNIQLIEQLCSDFQTFKMFKNIYKNGEKNISNYAMSFMGFSHPNNDSYKLQFSQNSINLYQKQSDVYDQLSS